MNAFSGRLFLFVFAALPVGSVATAQTSANLMTSHWDSVFLVGVGVLIVWREIRTAKRGGLHRNNRWQALESWQQPVGRRKRLIPARVKWAFRRSSR